MYYPNDIEDICYEEEHIQEVLAEMRKEIPKYLETYIQTEAGHIATEDQMSKLAAVFGSSFKPQKKQKDPKKVLDGLVKAAIEDFESDRKVYLEIFHLESLEEYKYDVGSFKNTVLRNQVPIIRKTLQNTSAKELDKYRIAFKESAPGSLFRVTSNIIKKGVEWKKDWYNPKEFENFDSCADLDYHELDEEEYTAYGVIGGGIKSHFLYKLHPEMYPFRSREAVWALWYLSNKKHFGCREDSEFLMINVKEGTTQQNYFYPYGLFAFYALEIFKRLRQLFAKYNVSLTDEYRFVIVEAFLSYVARQHQDEINLLKQNPENSYYEH